MRNPEKQNPDAANVRAANVKAYGRAHDSEKHTTSGLSPQARWNRANPEKLRAHAAVRSAIRRGELTRALTCCICGQPHDLMDAHHYDYSKPLSVMWTGRSCHRLLHSKRGKTDDA
jgi:hypothetical protein